MSKQISEKFLALFINFKRLANKYNKKIYIKEKVPKYKYP